MYQPEKREKEGAGDNSRINFYACFGGKQQKYLSHTRTESVEKKKQHIFSTFSAYQLTMRGKRGRERERGSVTQQDNASGYRQSGCCRFYCSPSLSLSRILCISYNVYRLQTLPTLDAVRCLMKGR